MFAACQFGHLDVAKWLFGEGAAEDIRTKDNEGHTPLLKACENGHLRVMKWLYEVGVIEDMYSAGRTLLLNASRFCHHPIVTWLVLQGAANNTTCGHVDAAILVRYMDLLAAQVALRRDLVTLIDQHSIFTRLVLPATRFAQAASAKVNPFLHSAPRSKKPRAQSTMLPLTLLCGHEDTLLALIADFVGVLRGRQLRNAREAVAVRSAYDKGGQEDFVDEEEEKEDEDEDEEIDDYDEDADE
jgi:hypothetical protein